MSAGFFLAQFLTGLASAASLFLAASGLSIIFGVTRVVNFAHGAFVMVGAYLAYTLTERLSGALGFWAGLASAAVLTAMLGVLTEMLLLRRVYRAPEFYQLLATFGLTLMAEDLVVLVWGPTDLLGRRAPGLRGALTLLGQRVPSYDLFLIALAPIILVLLRLLFQRTRWGVKLRAATQDRDMVAALGVNQKWLFTGVFALGVGLAGLGGALQIPREAVNHTMDLGIVVEVFVVVVIGGLGSVFGAFLASVLVGELNAFGILVLPGISLVLIFALMAAVLVLRPWGLLGRKQGATRASLGPVSALWRPLRMPGRLAAAALVVLAAALPLVAGPYALTVATEIAIFALFAASLHLLMGAGGLVSFGHAAYFGLGAYAAALLSTRIGAPMGVALLAAPLVAAMAAAVFGWFCVRLSGVYFAMLTLACAQIAWSVVFQSVALTGGDNGVLGIRTAGWATAAAPFFWLVLAITAGGIAALRVLVFSPFGYALRGVRDSILRAEAIGIDGRAVQWLAFVAAGAAAGLAGGLFAFLKGSVFPDTLGIPVSVNGLVMVLLGGVETTWGPLVGAALYQALSIWLISQTEYSKLVLGAIILLLVVVFPQGLVGGASRILARRGGSR